MKFALVPRACCVLAKLTTVIKSLGDALPRLSSHRFPCLPWYFYVLNSQKCWVSCCVLSVVYLMFRIVSQKRGEELTSPRFTLQRAKAGSDGDRLAPEPPSQSPPVAPLRFPLWSHYMLSSNALPRAVPSTRNTNIFCALPQNMPINKAELRHYVL